MRQIVKIKQITWLALVGILISLPACRQLYSPEPIADPFAALDLTRLTDVAIPSNHRNWTPDLALLPYSEARGHGVSIHNIRDFIYQSDEEFVVKYTDKTYDVREINSLDFIVVPFKTAPSLAHTMLSFGFADGSHLGVSAEARLETGETYSPWKGALRQYELMYILAEERDLIGRRTQYRDSDVFLYSTVATPVQAQAIFVDVLKRVNQLARQPEFYDTFRNNCTTNIVNHVNRLNAGAVPIDLRVLLPGFSDQYAYDLGLLRTDQPFAEARRLAHVNELANRYLDSPEFSERIRRR